MAPPQWLRLQPPLAIFSEGEVETGHPQLSLSRQCRLVGISIGSLYYQPEGESELNLDLMRQIDEQYLKTP